MDPTTERVLIIVSYVLEKRAYELKNAPNTLYIQGCRDTLENLSKSIAAIREGQDETLISSLADYHSKLAEQVCN